MKYIEGRETYFGDKIWGHVDYEWNDFPIYTIYYDLQGNEISPIQVKLYREDGPAIIRLDGTKLYYFGGKAFNNIEEWLEVIPNEWKIKALYNPDNF